MAPRGESRRRSTGDGGQGIAARRAFRNDVCFLSPHGDMPKGAVSACVTVSRYHESINLVALLDELREAYELAKIARHSELQARLMNVRRSLLHALHQSLDLYGEIADLQEQLTELRAENEQLREGGRIPPPAANELLSSDVRKMSP